MKTVVVRIQPYYQDRFRPWLEITDKLAERGYAIETWTPEGRQRGDVNVVQLDYLLGDPVLADTLLDNNLIVYERNGCAPVTGSAESRGILNDLRLIAWIKDITFRDPVMYNMPLVNNRYHLTYLKDEDGSVPEAKRRMPDITDVGIAKIRSCLPIYQYPRMDPFLDQPNTPMSARKVDLFLGANMDFPFTQVVRHRWQACEAILRTRRRSAIFTGNMLKTPGYVEMLRRPKMMVSPYGSGGYSWKDFEAMYMGIVLIKPDCEFSKTYGFDIFDGSKHIVKCKPDFSDLSDVVDSIMDQQREFEDLAIANRAAIYSAHNPDLLAGDLANIFGQSA